MNFFTPLVKVIKKASLSFVLPGMSILYLVSCSSDNSPEPVDCDINGIVIENLETTVASCGINDGSIKITATGGSGIYSYSLNGTDFQASNVFDNLQAGNYTVFVTDDLGCEAQGSTAVPSDAGIGIEVIVLAESGCDTDLGKIEINGLDGSEPYVYKLNEGSYQGMNIIENLTSGIYSVSVKDANGCEVTTEIEISSGTKLQQDIVPILNTNCAVSGCHDGGNGLPNFSDTSQIISYADNINTRTGNQTMPPSYSDKSLTDEEIALIACWVDDGAEDN